MENIGIKAEANPEPWIVIGTKELEIPDNFQEIPEAGSCEPSAGEPGNPAPRLPQPVATVTLDRARASPIAPTQPRNHVHQRRRASSLQQLQCSHFRKNRKGAGQEVAPGALHVQHVPQAHRRRQVPPARRRRALRVLLRSAPQPALPRLRRAHHRPRDPGAGRVVAREPLRVRRLPEGAGRRRVHGTGGAAVLLGVLRGQVRGTLQGLRAAHRGQGHHRAGRQVAPRVLHLQQMPKPRDRRHLLRDGQQAPLRQMRLNTHT